ncbi:unnamed protein product [Leptosia nina]|uniref:Dendritic cell-specific transmembrane protein-like domain-containing protein n=1 Tax=Leptosia nina TaxID=320188 RepID=A0AAV1IVB1_9NEOP
MSSIIGLLLTLGLAFSNRLRCLVFLLIPQFFSRIGRYTLTCYALILILTGPATNTLRNSEVLTESMACSQEQIKTNVRHLSDSMKQPFHAMKDSVRLMLNKFDRVSGNMKDILLKIERMVISVADVIQSSHSWLVSVVNICNRKLGTPYNHCMNILKKGIPDCKSILGSKLFWCNVTNVEAACQAIKSHKEICVVDDFARGSFAATIQRKWRSFTKRVKTMFFVNIQVHHKYTVSNASRSASQVAAGIVTEIRNRADPLITWLSWSSCVTSLFLLLIIFRAKYYQHMYETRSRFDNRYVTQELYEIDLKRFQEGRDTILPLNRRERTKYIPTTSFRLIATEKVFMSRSAVFMMITTFKLMIHIIADYSLFWVLTTIEHHGRLQTQIPPGPSDAGVKITGTGFAAELLKSIFNILTIPLQTPTISPTACLPNPHPPDFQRYTQIGVIIVILWLLALFEPYGLRLRHVIMGHHRPERAKARANWLYNHILRTRGSFMKLARRKLHREYKYCGYEHLTFRHWLDSRLPCETPKCPGIFCNSCFNDIGKLCTICLSPADYGDYSDISLEKGSSDDDSDDTYNSYECKDDSSKDYFNIKIPNGKLSDIKRTNQNRQRNLHVGYKNSSSFSEKGPLLLPQYDQTVMRKRINNKIALKNKRTNIDFTIILNKDNRHTIQLGQQQATSTKINLQETNKNELHNKRAQKCSKDVDMPKHKTKSKNHYKYTKPLFVAFSTCFKLNNKYVSSTDLNSSNQSKHGSKNHKSNFKRRKKKENNKIYIKRQNEISRNYRISAYLQDQSWVKGSLHRDSLKSRIRKECALNQLARCRMYAASNKEREADLLNKIKDTICVKTRVCTCPKGVCICKNNQEVHIDDTKKPISKEMKKGCSKCECHYDCKKIAKKKKSAVGSKTKKFVDWCRGNKKNCCKIQNVNREEDASPSYWKPSELIEVHQYENNHDDLKTTEERRSPKKIGFLPLNWR